MKATMVLVGLASALLAPVALAGGGKKPPLPPETKVLERWVGTWSSEVISKPSVFDKEGSRLQGTSREEMTLGGRFLRGHVKHKSDAGASEFITLRTYDQNKMAFRSWSFWITDRASGTNELTGKWDEATKTMTEAGEDERGAVLSGRVTFKDVGFEAVFLVKNKEGAVLLDRHAVIRPRKADNTAAPPAKPTQAKSPELKILERYLGTWDTETVNRVSEWNPKEVRSTGTVTNEWILDGRFVQMQAKESTGSEGLQIRTYDPVKKTFRAWHFDSKGAAVSSAGTWDEDKATMTWKADLGNGITGTNVVRFAGADVIEWNLVASGEDRKVFLDMGGKFKRKKNSD